MSLQMPAATAAFMTVVHLTCMGVVILFSIIRLYFCFFVAALRPCHGRAPWG